MSYNPFILYFTFHNNGRQRLWKLKCDQLCLFKSPFCSSEQGGGCLCVWVCFFFLFFFVRTGLYDRVYETPLNFSVQIKFLCFWQWILFLTFLFVWRRVMVSYVGECYSQNYITQKTLLRRKFNSIQTKGGLGLTLIRNNKNTIMNSLYYGFVHWFPISCTIKTEFSQTSLGA